MTTRNTSAIFTTLVIATIAITLLTSTTNTFTSFVLAAKAGLSHHSSKDSNGNSSSGIDKNGDSNSGTSTNTGSSSSDNAPSTSNDNENLKNLFACESAAANGSGKLTKTEVMNCYSQTFSHSFCKFWK